MDHMRTAQSKRVFLAMAVCFGTLSIAGCNGYWAGAYWRGGAIAVQQPGPYAYEYYFDPVFQAYYCYYPSYGWRYCPSPPPPNAVFWRGPVPQYLPPPGPVVGFNYYFDPARRVYYYQDRDNRWHYYPGRPPQQARFWQGPRPRMLPEPPRGAPVHRPPGPDRERRGQNRR